MFEASQTSDSSSSIPGRPQANASILAGDKPKVSFVQTLKASRLRGAAPVFLPKMLPTQIPVTPKPKDTWQTVQRKKATCQGTKTTMVSGIIPATHQIPRALLMSVSDKALTRHLLGILKLVPGAEALLSNNPLK